ncbi:MAG: hypothetical protein LBR48_00250, partial [Dysgonamonadaceae bacterium]|nr:hypothetical protein [Dysgonamonadaceae bacterium]
RLKAIQIRHLATVETWHAVSLQKYHFQPLVAVNLPLHSCPYSIIYQENKGARWCVTLGY